MAAEALPLYLKRHQVRLQKSYWLKNQKPENQNARSICSLRSRPEIVIPGGFLVKYSHPLVENRACEFLTEQVY